VKVGWRLEVGVIVFYLALALAFTWPLALHWREAIPGDGRDGWQSLWNLWWLRHALEHAQNPYQTNLLFYPQGTNLYLHTLLLFDGLVSLPVQYLAGPVAAYNFCGILSLTLAAYGGFSLAHYLWGGFWSGLFAGVAFGFSSYHFAHLLGHLNLISSWFIPFYILFFFKALNRKQHWRKSAILAVLTLVCGTLLELQYILYLAIFSLLYLTYLIFIVLLGKWRKLEPNPAKPKLLTSWGRAILIGLIFLLITLPLTIPTLVEALNNPNTVPAREDNVYAADALAYLYPSPFHPLWGGPMREVIRPWTATLIEKVVFPGYMVYLLALLGGLRWFWQKQRRGVGKPEQAEIPPIAAEVKINKAAEWKPGAVFWLLVLLVFVLLSFGRKLHINGLEYGPTLPAALIYKLPILNITRVPARYAVIALLSLAMLAGHGLRKVPSSRFQVPGFTDRAILRAEFKVQGFRLFSVLALIALIFELWPAPYQLSYYEVPQFYAKLGREVGQGAILDVPLNVGRDYQYLTDYMKAQIEHGKPLIGGYIARNPVYPPYYGVPVFWEFAQFQNGSRPDILPALAPADEKALLQYFGVGYIVVHKDLVRGKRQEAVLGQAFRLFPQGPIYDAENLVVFEVPPASAQSSPLFFANLVQPTWYEVEKGGDGRYSRWAQGDQSGLDLWSDRPRTIEITLPLWSFHETHMVGFSFNNMMILQQEIKPEPQEVRLKLPLKPGRNRLDLKISGKVNRPADLGPGNDTRLLTIAVGQISLKME